MLLVSNNAYELRGVRGFARRSRLDRGELGVTSLALESGAATAAAIGLALAGNPDAHPGCRIWSTRRFAVDAEGPVEVGIDGEPDTLEPPLVFTSRPGALTVLLPPGAVVRSRRSGNVTDLARLAAGARRRRP